MKVRNFLVYCSSIALIAYSIWVIFFRYDTELEKIISSLGLIIIQFLVAIYGFYLARHKLIDIRIRRGWIFLGLAAFSNVIAECLWYYYESVLGINPFPSLADFFYLLYYPLTLIGVLLLPFKPLKRVEFFIYLFDLSIVMLAVTMIYWYFILAPNQVIFEGGWESINAIAYPIGDLLLFAGVAALIQRNTEKISRWTSIFIATSVLIMAVPDSYFAYYEVNDIPYSMAYINILWLFSALCMLFAIHKQMGVTTDNINPVSRFTDRSQRLLRISLPYAAAATGPTLLASVINSSVLTGLQIQGLLIGVILLVVLVLGRQQIVLMDNKQLYEETHKLAITDSLTGVHNRHFFNEVFQQEIERARRYKKTFSVLLIDVDNFKAINDTFGHLKGDSVLKMIAASLKEEVRQTDILARFGGDEFAVILPETDLFGASTVSQKIENKVKMCSFADTSLSVSIGAASFQPGLTAEQFLEEADRELYKNKLTKNPGRNFSTSVLIS